MNREKINKQIIKRYEKALKQQDNFLDYFLLFLKKRRAEYILCPLDDTTTQYKVETLSAAIFAYAEYNNCIADFYDVQSGYAVRLDPTKSAETVAKDYAAAKTFYWNYFWEIVKQNLESWLEPV